MIVYRLSKEKYAKTLSASGAANRWNLDGQFVLYTASSRALATLEQVVHLAGIIPRTKYKMIAIELTEIDNSIELVKLSKLDKDWRKLSSYHKQQLLGSKWYKQNEKLALRVPSAIIQEEHNYVLNTSHPKFQTKVKIVNIEDYFWDERLFNV